MRSNGTLKILIVDDTKGMREEFCAVCREFVPDARIDEAPDAVKALGLLQKEIPAYDVVFTDMGMLEMNGLKLISHVRDLSHYKETPVIVISKMSGRDDVERALQLGANGYLTRPLQKEDFEVVHLAYLNPILKRKKNGAKPDAEDLVKSLRKMLK